MLVGHMVVNRGSHWLELQNPPYSFQNELINSKQVQMTFYLSTLIIHEDCITSYRA